MPIAPTTHMLKVYLTRVEYEDEGNKHRFYFKHAMKIAVIAANGRAGKAFVETALAAGHSVRAGVFGKSYLEPIAYLPPPKLLS